MKRLFSLIAMILCISLLLSPLAFAAPAPPRAFTDIDGHWAEETIERFADAGIILGFPDGTFRPNQRITRAELAAIVTRAFELSEEVEFHFDDVSPNAWYYEYLRFAANVVPSDQFVGQAFFPNISAHRIDTARTVIPFYIERLGITIDMPTDEAIVEQVRAAFGDSDYRYSSNGASPLFRTTWLAHHLEIMVGRPSGNFRPYWGTTRAEMLTILERVLIEE